MDYIDRTVIKLKRKYSKDELVAHLTKKLKETEIELGKTKSENEELKYNIEKAFKENKKLKQQILTLTDNVEKSQPFKAIQGQLKSQKDAIENQRKSIRNLHLRIRELQ